MPIVNTCFLLIPSTLQEAWIDKTEKQYEEITAQCWKRQGEGGEWRAKAESLEAQLLSERRAHEDLAKTTQVC